MKRDRSLLILGLIAFVVLGAQLGLRGLNEPDEGRTASIGYEMYAAHEWLTPRLFDHAHFNKPPLVYWLLMVSYRLGGVNEWTARLPSALAAWGTIMITALLARRLTGASSGLASGLILLTCPLFFAMSQIIDYNMTLTFWITLALWGFVAWQQDGKSWQRWIFYLSIALSCLTKGPVGPAIILLTVAGCKFRGHPSRPWRKTWSWPLALACAALSLSWFVAVAVQHPGLWRYFLVGEMYDRVFTKIHHRGEPLLYYVAILPLAVLPWLYPAGRAIVARFKRSQTDFSSRLLVAWIILPLILLTVSSSKMPTYILPLLPAIAIIAADATTISKLRLLITSGSMLILYHAALTVAHMNETKVGPHSTARQLARVLEQNAKPGDPIVLVERNPRGLSFYLKRPISVSLNKFTLQIESDFKRLKEKDFEDPLKVFQWFDSTQRVFFVCTDRVMAERERDAVNKPKMLYRDTRCVLISNQ